MDYVILESFEFVHRPIQIIPKTSYIEYNDTSSNAELINVISKNQMANDEKFLSMEKKINSQKIHKNVTKISDLKDKKIISSENTSYNNNKLNEKNKIKLQNNEFIKLHKRKIKISDLIGLEYHIKYKISDNEIVVCEEIGVNADDEDIDLEERTRIKYARKKMNKKEKPFTILPLTPLNYHYFLTYKNRSHLYSLSIFSALSYYFEKQSKIIIYEQKNCLLAFTALYQGVDELKLLGNKRTEKYIGNQFIKLELFDDYVSNENSICYDTFIISEQLELNILIQIVDKTNFWNHLVIFCEMRSYAEAIFKLLIKSGDFGEKEHDNTLSLQFRTKFVNAKMCDFIHREYQIGSFHPLVRGNWGEGYVVTAQKINFNF